MKMRRTPKAKLDIPAEMSLQLMPANSIEEHVVTVADSGASMPMKKRKEDASKPLYLKRV
jgi:hypothetical protein